MRVTVIFPKWKSYAGKGLDAQRSMNEVYRRYLDMLKNAGCTFEVILEDVQAMEIMKSLGYEPDRIVTCLNQADLRFLMSQNNCDDMPDYVFSMHSSVTDVSAGSEKLFPVDIALAKEDKSKYMEKRVESYRKRLKHAFERHMTESKATLVFRSNNANDRVSPVGDLIRMGDGKLYIEVDINNGSVVSYYGGVYVTDDVLPVILST